MSKRFLDQDALNYNPRKPGADMHVSKHKARNKALEIVFDPKSHKEYITGFRKRKQARRKEALGKLEKRQRQQRLDERAERRQSMKDQLNLGDAPKGSDDDASDEEPTGEAVRVFHSGAMTSTVTVARISAHSDSEPEGSGAEDDEEEPGAGPRRAAKAAPKEYPAPAPREAYNKLTKCSLRVMRKTKLKIEGKKAVGGVRGAGGPAGGKGGKGAGGKAGRAKGKGRR